MITTCPGRFAASVPGFATFIWRAGLSPAELNAAWARVPTPGEERILWMSLPPLGDKVKARMGQLLGEWNEKKQMGIGG